ncbi:DUF2619 domain-containing protein [Thalassobacillus sp. C254]
MPSVAGPVVSLITMSIGLVSISDRLSFCQLVCLLGGICLMNYGFNKG